MILKFMGVAVTAGMMQLLWPIEPLPVEEPPEALVQEVMSYRIVSLSTCDLPELGLRDAECIATYDGTAKRSWILIFDEQVTVTMVIVHDTTTHLLWCRSDVCM